MIERSSDVVAMEFSAGVSEERFQTFFTCFQQHHISFHIDTREIPVCDIEDGEIVLLNKKKRIWRFYVSIEDYEKAEILAADLPRYSNEGEQLMTFRLAPSCPNEEDYEDFPELKVWMPLDE